MNAVENFARARARTHIEEMFAQLQITGNSITRMNFPLGGPLDALKRFATIKIKPVEATTSFGVSTVREWRVLRHMYNYQHEIRVKYNRHEPVVRISQAVNYET